MSRRLITPLALSLCLTACFFPPEPLELSRFYTGDETPDNFSICHSFDCGRKAWTSLSSKEWNKVKAPLRKKAKSAQEERNHIATSVALFEQVVGKKVGTEIDDARADAFKQRTYQLDCIDETANTNLYLTFLQKEGLFKWHIVADPAQRGRFINGSWPHHTAIIREEESGNSYAVDSWFLKNGEEPFIVTLATWLNGWEPPSKAPPSP